jgi:hypothetical protein
VKGVTVIHGDSSTPRQLIEQSSQSRVPDAVQRFLRRSAEPGFTPAVKLMDSGSAAHHAASAACCAASGERTVFF